MEFACGSVKTLDSEYTQTLGDYPIPSGRYSSELTPIRATVPASPAIIHFGWCPSLHVANEMRPRVGGPEVADHRLLPFSRYEQNHTGPTRVQSRDCQLYGR